MKIDKHFFKKLKYELIRRTSSKDYVQTKIASGPLAGSNWCVKAGGNYYPLGIYEEETATVIEHYLSEGDVFFDLGANTGYFSLLASKAVGASGSVYAFEPFPRNIGYLEEHVRTNKLSNLHVMRYAVADERGEVEFSLENNQSGNTYLKESSNFSEVTKHITVPKDSLDNLYGDGALKAPNLIKIDVEGAEHDVLQGATELLKKHQPVLILSTHERYLPGIKQKCLNLLDQLGYGYEMMDLANQQNHIEGLEDFVCKTKPENASG